MSNDAMAFWCCSYFCLKSCQIPQIPNNLAYGKIPKFDDQLSARLFREEKKKKYTQTYFGYKHIQRCTETENILLNEMFCTICPTFFLSSIWKK